MKILENGKWFKVENEKQHTNLKLYKTLECDESYFRSDIQIGDYKGAGWYLVVSYQQKCPRGCCYDTVCKTIPANEVVEMIEEEIEKLTGILESVKTKTE